MLAVPSNLRFIDLQRFLYTLSTSAHILFISIFIKRILKEQVRSGVLLQSSSRQSASLFSGPVFHRRSSTAA